MSATPHVKHAYQIDELAYYLTNYCNDEGVEPSALDLDFILSEAKYVLSLFSENGHLLVEMASGEHGPEERAYAEKNAKQLRAFIRKYDKK